MADDTDDGIGGLILFVFALGLLFGAAFGVGLFTRATVDDVKDARWYSECHGYSEGSGLTCRRMARDCWCQDASDPSDAWHLCLKQNGR